MPILVISTFGTKLKHFFQKLLSAVALFNLSSHHKNGTMALLPWMEVLFGESILLPQFIDVENLSRMIVKSSLMFSCAHLQAHLKNGKKPVVLKTTILDLEKFKNSTMVKETSLPQDRASQMLNLDTMLNQQNLFQEDLILLILIILPLPGQCKLKDVLMEPPLETYQKVTTLIKWLNGTHPSSFKNDSEQLVLMSHTLLKRIKNKLLRNHKLK